MDPVMEDLDDMAIQPPLVILEDLATATLTSSTVDMEAMSIMLMEVLMVAFSRVEILFPPVSTRVWHMEVDMDLDDMAIQPPLVILEDLATATLTSSTVDMEDMSIMLMEVLMEAFSRVEILFPPVCTRV